uniref:Uncharacterized protein n=1 Tax=Emiliania huxleyi TaxID=2903 RepID=A0A7S3TVG9_EMIHU
MKRTPPAAAVRDGTATSRRRGAEAADRLRVLDSNMDSLLLCSMAICGFCGWGWYLFDMGTSDFRIGLDAAGTSDSCSWKPQLEALDRLIPFLLIVRAATLPHLWHTLGAQPRRWMVALLTPACIGFLFALVLPLAWVTALVLQPGLQSVFNFNATLQQWPTDCAVNRPFHGLLQARMWALFTGLWMETTMVIQTTRSFTRPASFGKSGAATSLVPLILGMFMGPLQPLAFEGIDAQCPDTARLIAYIVIAIGSNGIKLALRLHSSLIPAAVASPSPLSRSRALQAWLATSLVEILSLEAILCTAVELRSGPPFDDMCGAGSKEFFFPRLRGFVYFEYAQLVITALWVQGCWQRQGGATARSSTGGIANVAPAKSDMPRGERG